MKVRYYKILAAAVFLIIPFQSVFSLSVNSVLNFADSSVPIVFLILFSILPLFFKKVEGPLLIILLTTVLASVSILLFLYQQEYLVDSYFQLFRYIAILPVYYIIGEAIALDFIFIGSAASNTMYLAIGAFLSNLIGGPAAGLLLLKPLIRANKYRKNAAHVFIFFIIVVLNSGAMISPVANTHLYIAYLRGFSPENFIKIIPYWLVINGTLLFVFYLYENILTWKDPVQKLPSIQIANELITGLQKHELRQSTILRAVEYLEKPVFDIKGAGSFWFFPLILIVIVFSGIVDKYFVREILLCSLVVIAYFFSPFLRNKKKNDYLIPFFHIILLHSFSFLVMGMIFKLLYSRYPIYINNSFESLAFSLISGIMDNVPASLLLFKQELFTRASINEFAFINDIIFSQKKFLHIMLMISGISIFGGLTYTGNYMNIFVRDEVRKNGIKMPGYFRYMLISLPVIFFTTAVLYIYAGLSQ